MIATRGLKAPTFGVGERVLCFEPDPTKVRVLYDSKILKVDWTRDSGGKRVPEYLVHFNGWNHSWDRWAPEHFILKFTDENLELQEKLQKEAEEKMRKKRRKRTWSEILEEAKERREQEAKENSASSADDSSAGSSDSDDEDDDDEAVEVPITFPEALHAKLEDDCYFITSKKQLVKLPPEHTALCLMEAYVKDFAYRCQAHNVRVHVRQQGTAGMPVCLTSPIANNGDSVVPPPLPQYNVDLCREVMDGIRILFDFLLPTNLLYNCERAQYERCYAQQTVKTNSVKEESAKQKPCPNGNVRTTRRCSATSSSKDVLPPVLEPATPGPNDPPPVLKPEPVLEEKEKQEQAPARRVTRRTSSTSFNQSPPPQPPPAPSSTRELRSSDSQRRRSADAKISSPSLSNAISTSTSTHNKRDETDTKEHSNPHPHPRSLRHSSRLASSSSPTTPSPPIITNMDSIPSLEASAATATPQQNMHALTNGDAKEPPMKLRGARGSLSTADVVGKIPQTAELSIKQEDGDDGVFSIEKNCWKLLPDMATYSGAEPACRVYGPQHLLRLFVKLPEILGRMDLPPRKLKPLVKHIEMFLRWLSATDQLLEYFPDKAYINESKALKLAADYRSKRTLAAK